ncbi:MAG: hypothetical protein A3E07_03145 [Candidatus Wildermuthbacteria bacterium RIFCSPHIGHO2_12_FULL_45_9]|uniref:PEGA domain-containing protein n=1 Tax=Candidatus Wildermuthbacteria bacterium RIFCSPHIGHO2_02_FULL_45_25 TaxID=1802450 RepID=A0A1G2QXB7_9BACT|nr:MAG: hypothetical protein A2748_02715 [Candidatus Wildermuthbacteria bacterium RIFCSPHIGHO2_01_FULL_45_20]OHA65274.1 MAG: hypothetical protein A3C04_03140 [Candidatus Wildermuthbacteria bacterium RIFCSPHIGHO2_02_FULL_45_25]OHA71463.1 MAG: hypothetical protein A3E07_03145 [Candidatus Wildermuthbacteria bacterium RIFCSPHIGHO2_12_FULL_45_9]
MTKRTRTLLFFFLGFLFLCSTPLLILYSQGYRIDWNSRTIGQIGAIHFHIDPARADILIDQQHRDRTLPLVNTAFIQNLVPQTYHAQVVKEGYHSWEKDLEVTPRQVTEANNILLLPKNINFKAVAGNVMQWWQSPNHAYAIVQEQLPNNKWRLLILSYDNETLKPFYDQKSFTETVGDIKWNIQSSEFLAQIQSREQTALYLWETSKTLSQNSSPAPPPASPIISSAQDISHLDFSPRTNSLILLRYEEQGNELLQIQYDAGKISQTEMLASNVLAFTVSGTHILWIDGEGRIWDQNDRAQTPESVNITVFPIDPELPYQLYYFGGKVFLQENRRLFILNDSRVFEELFPLVDTIALSPDGKKLAFAQGSESWLYFLSDELDQPKHSRGEKVFLTRFSQPISDLSWLNSHYLIFRISDEIKAMEIDTRDNINTVTLLHFISPSFRFNPATKFLSIYSEKKLFVTEKLF